MTTRAKATEETRRRILQAAFDLQSRHLAFEIVLDAVAAEAGVSVQTVLRHFGSRAGLFDEAVLFAQDQIAEERRAPVGDVAGAIRVLVDHYEKRGDLALIMLAQEGTYEGVRRMSDRGKAMHRAWVAEVFAASLDDLGGLDGDDQDGDARDELLDLLVVATDVYAWKLLRRDRALSRDVTEHRLNTLVTAVLTAAVHRKES